MGRIPLGDLPMSDHEAGLGRWRRKPNAVGLIAPVSKRKPFGLYSVLGLEVGATKAQITKQYRQLALEFHPDRNSQGTPQSRSNSTKKMQQLTAAYEVLSDPVSRSAYDCEHWATSTSNSALRSRVHRSRMTAAERGTSEAIKTARKKMQAKKEVFVRGKQVAVREVSARSKVVGSSDSWTVVRRSKRARKKDHRLGTYAAFPSSLKPQKKKKKKGQNDF